MGKTIVVYTSKYGSTKKYAEEIAARLNCDIKALSEADRDEILSYDNILYGGGVHAGGIKGIDKFMKWVKPILSDAYYEALDSNVDFHKEEYRPAKNIAFFAVGLNVQSFDARAQLRNVNFNKKWQRLLTCYYLDGRYEPERVVGIDKLIMKFVVRMLRNKGLNMNEDERTLLKRIENGCDLLDLEQVKPIVEAFKEA